MTVKMLPLICTILVLLGGIPLKTNFVFTPRLCEILAYRKWLCMQGSEMSLAYYRFGSGDCDKQLFTWTSVSLDLKYCWMQDLTFYRGKFYAVSGNHYVVVVDGLELNDDGDEQVERRPFLSVEVIAYELSEDVPHQYYMVQSADDLIVVLRYLTLEDGSQNRQGYWHDPYKTGHFKLLKLDFGTPTNNFSGCKPNCIYFTDNNFPYFYKRPFGGHDIGIFHLEDGSIEKFLYSPDTIYVMPPPVWFMPYHT